LTAARAAGDVHPRFLLDMLAHLALEVVEIRSTHHDVLAARGCRTLSMARVSSPTCWLRPSPVAALRRQPVVLRLAVALERAVLGGNPAALDQAVERWIERALLDQQNIVRALDRLGNRMTVRGTGPQRSQDEQIEGAPEQRETVVS
jgi:hypothetical protein